MKLGTREGREGGSEVERDRQVWARDETGRPCGEIEKLR